MLDSILEKVKGEIGGSLMEKFGLDSNQSDKAFSLTGETLKETIQKESAGGGLKGIMNLFSSDDNDDEGNSMLDNIGKTLSSKFSSELGVDATKSSGIADMLLSKVTSMFGSKLGSGFDVSSLLGMLGEEKGGGLMDKIGGLFGK